MRLHGCLAAMGGGGVAWAPGWGEHDRLHGGGIGARKNFRTEGWQAQKGSL